MSVYIKNIAHEKALSLADQVVVVPGQIVSRTLAQNQFVSITLFAFSKGEEISTHQSEGDAMVTVLSGTGRLTVDGTEHIVKAGQTPSCLHANRMLSMPQTILKCCLPSSFRVNHNLCAYLRRNTNG